MQVTLCVKACKDYPERKRLQGVFKAKAKADHEAYLTAIIDEVEKDLRCNRLGSAFKAIKQISGKQTHSNPVSINKADDSQCENEDEVLLRWREHFEQALNHSPGTSSASLDTETASATVDASTTSTDEPSLPEVTKAITKLRNGRAPGSDGIAADTAEVCHHSSCESPTLPIHSRLENGPHSRRLEGRDPRYSGVLIVWYFVLCTKFGSNICHSH